jgi:uncharacterized phage protein gp47/JayE
MAGLTNTGFVVPTISEIKAELDSQVKAKIDPRITTDPYSLFGQLDGIHSEREYLLWLGLRDVYNAYTLGGATGQALTNLGLTQGIARLPATKSDVTATVNLNAGTTLPQGSQARVPGTSESFETMVAVTNGGGSAADLQVVMQAVNVGPVVANSGTLTEIVTPVFGWNTVTNALDADVGSLEESDSSYRIRIVEEQRTRGSASLASIVAAVDAVDGVLSASGTEDVVQHHYTITFWDGDPSGADSDEVAQAIFDHGPAGIEAMGANSGQAVDLEGVAHTIKFNRAVGLNLYLHLTLLTDPVTYPVDGDEQVKIALVNLIDATLGVGDDVIVLKLVPAVFSVSGVLDITSLQLDFSPSPTGTSNLVVADNQIARADTSRITVSS